MKTATSILSLCLAFSLSAQESDSTEKSIKRYLVGIWQHIRSVEPNGDVEEYQREFQLQADGSGQCIKYVEGDTLYLPFQWELQDSTITLYITDKKGKKREADQQYITWMGKNVMEFHQQFDADEFGKRCAYRRKPDAMLAKY